MLILYSLFLKQKMQKSFLESIAEYYVQKYKTDLSSFCFVFPGRRAGLFFRSHLNNLISKPIWSPKILTINELFEQSSSLLTSDSISLLFELHEIYNEVLNQNITFDEFISWGEMFLNDFNDIDKHLISAKQIYTNLSDIKKLDDDYSHLTSNQLEAIHSFWGTFNVIKNSSDQEKFINVWDRLNIIYNTFSNRLKQQGEAYSGMHYRIVAENIANKNFTELPYSKLIFAGFNALTPAEKKLFTHLKNNGKADFFWDYSDWIISTSQISENKNSDNYGAGFFIKDSIYNYPPPTDWTLPIPEKESSPEITIVPVSTSLDQVSEISSFLLENSKDDLSTALILTDENMLIPALHGIPEQIEHINITMGYPLKNTPAYGLTELLYNLQKQLRTGKDNKTWFYHKQIIPLLQHQYITLLAQEKSKQLLKNIISNNRLFIEAKEFQTDKLFSSIFKKIDSSTSISAYLKNIFELIFNKLDNNNEKIIEREFIYSIYKTVTRLEDILKKHDKEIETSTWFGLLKKLLEFQTVPFEGEPLAGLQVMGILETRALDFENLIILNLNEGVFPRTAPPNSFIPYSLRIGFGLPTIEYQDNIFSYYFFRLIHRVKKVSLVYTTATQGNQSGEMSRFLYLLKYLHPANPTIKIYNEEVKLLPAPPIITVKTKNVQVRLDEFYESGGKHLSASSLSTYIDCPMRFYYQKVTQISEPDEIIEEADARIFGLIFHDVAENIYKPYIGKVITKEILDKLITNTQHIKQLINKAFQNRLTSFDFNSSGYMNLYGKNSMVIEVTKHYILKFLEKEKSICPVTILDLEKKVEWLVPTNSSPVKIKGYIDRIDSKDGITRVIDYKTGVSQNSFAEVKDLFDTDKHSKVKAVFQTILYSNILSSIDGEGKYQPGIINVKDLFKNDYSININQKPLRKQGVDVLLEDVKEEFAEHLQTLLEEIFNYDIPFIQTNDIKKCGYCPYRELCRR